MTTVTAATVADKVVDKTAAIADKAIDHAGDFGSAAADKATNVIEAASNIISHAVDTYGPQAVDAVLWSSVWMPSNIWYSVGSCSSCS